MVASQPSETWQACAEEPLEGNYFVSTYPPFSCWSADEIPAARRRLDAAAEHDAVPLGLYTHIPFCAQRCDYCYYRSYEGASKQTVTDYLDALLAELTLYRCKPAFVDRRPAFVYFGGGTPSLLSTEQLERLLEGMQRLFPWSSAEEVTFESAPRSVNRDKIDFLRQAGVTRLSLGVQQLDDAVLERNGRVHRTRDVERAYAIIERAGFPTVNVDLMVGMVDETDETFFRSLERAIALQPGSVTIYQMEMPRNTPLFHAWQEGSLQTEPASWDVKRRRLGEAFARLEAAGYRINSAYMAVRDQQAHRFVYQDLQYRGADLLGIGVAAFSYAGGLHFQNHGGLEQYGADIARSELPWRRAHVLSDEERLVREFVLQLKLGCAVAEDFRRKFGVQIAERFAAPLETCAARGWLSFDDRGVTLTRQGLLRVDRFLSEFYLPPHREATYW